MASFPQRSQSSQHPDFSSGKHLDAIDEENAHTGCWLLVAGRRRLDMGDLLLTD
jgi:hypothetical protein